MSTYYKNQFEPYSLEDLEVQSILRKSADHQEKPKHQKSKSNKKETQNPTTSKYGSQTYYNNSVSSSKINYGLSGAEEKNNGKKFYAPTSSTSNNYADDKNKNYPKNDGWRATGQSYAEMACCPTKKRKSNEMPYQRHYN